MHAHARLALCLAPLLLAAGCDSSTYSFRSDTSDPPRDELHAPGAVGDVVVRPHPGPKESRRFIVDPHGGGQNAEVRVTRTVYGRLVDVYSLGAGDRRVFQQKDFVIDPALASDGLDYQLEEHPVTGATDLVVLRSLATAQGIAEFEALLVAAEANLVTLADNGLPDESGAWSMLPRDAAVVLHLDDLLDEGTITPRTVRALVGSPNVVPYTARVLGDQNHGSWVQEPSGARAFHSTRVVVDLTIERLEALEADPALPSNPAGLPASVETQTANVSLRVATQATASQPLLLANLAGNPLATTGNGTVDFGSPTRDVVRAARSGGDEDDTGDPFNGFLADSEAPRLVGGTPVTILGSPQLQAQGGALDFELQLAFDGPSCARAAERGDALVQPGFLAVVSQTSAPPVGGVLERVRVRLVHGASSDWPSQGAGPATFSGPFDALRDAGREACVPRVTPTANGYPDAPTSGIQPASLIALAFSEPVRNELSAIDGIALTRERLALAEKSGYAWVPCDVLGGAPEENGLVLVPVLPLAHATGSAESLWLQVRGGLGGVHDLAGNALDDGLADLELTLDPQAASSATGGHVSRFASADEDPPFGDSLGPLPEWWGQHLYDLVRQEIRPRPVVHWEAVIDRSNPVVGLMTPYPPGVRTPLNPMGAKLQTLWRHVDLGLTHDDIHEQNLDVEGLAWSPLQGVIADAFAAFEIAVGHAKYLPDEVIDSNSLFPKFAYSGLVDTYASNVADAGSSPLEVVHERSKGFVVSPGDVYQSPSGTLLLPTPWNEGVEPAEQTRITWRDTSLRLRRAPNGGGVPLWQERFAYGLPQPANRYNDTKNVRTLGLPLLMEFRCWPDPSALGLNFFDVSLAASSSSRPYFRAFSEGGVDSSGNVVLVDPDLETHANGGYDPTSNPPGQKTFGLDNVSRIGSLDFVTRVSRSHSVWFAALDGQGNLLANPSYSDALLEGALPAGTSIALAYRGAESFTPQPDSCDGSPNLDPLEDARTIDLYGDHYDDRCIPSNEVPDHNPERSNLGLALTGGEEWKDSAAAIDGASYVQLRLTFVANAASGEHPTVSTVAVAWGE